MSQKDYAERVGLPATNLRERWYAAEVAQKSDIRFSDLGDRWQHLSAIHPAPEWLWPALVVRPVDGAFEIISGHHRKLAAERAGLDAVPCWVREMDDASAYMALALNNAQGELSPLEVGLHALHSGLSQTEYGKQMGLSQDSISLRMRAAKVADTTRVVNGDLWRHLAEIKSAPEWLWRALVAAMVAGEWTVETTRKAVASRRIETNRRRLVLRA